MAVHLGWQEILLRLILTAIAGGLVGLNRGEHGRPAGLRTTMLVCLAAAVSMIQVNLLLSMAGKPADSFVSLDLMRLPLGILTGMGFIGGGAILKKGDVVLGVTTAATLWFVTTMGLCFGAGQIALGCVTLALGMLVLTTLKHVEAWIPRDRKGTLVLTATFDGPAEEVVFQRMHDGGFTVSSSAVRYEMTEKRWTLVCEVRWPSRSKDPLHPPVIKQLAELPEVLSLEWTPEGLVDHVCKP